MTTDAEREYRRWYQRIRSRAVARLVKLHDADFRRLLSEEQAAEPYITER